MADETPSQQAVELTDELRGWINEQLSIEVKRIESMGSKCLPIPVFDFCTEAADGPADSSLVHVITAKTKFDFAKAKQVMVSEPKSAPDAVRGGLTLKLVFVVLLTDKPIPLMMPYLYDVGAVPKEDSLSQWCFINSDGQAVRHDVTF